MTKNIVNEIANKLCLSPKGILAADESTNTIKKRFESINIESNFESRRSYRELLFKTKNLNEFISGVILYDETIKQKTDLIVEEENKKLSKFIGRSSSDLKTSLGNPDEDFRNEIGNLVLVYNTKKYGIPCERRFEINSNSIVIGFVSNGCF